MTDKKTSFQALKQWGAGAVQRMLVKQTVLIKQGQLYAIGDKYPKQPRLAIVGREHYKVSEKSYPIAKRSAVLKVAKREFAAAQTQQFSVSPLTNGKRTVRVVTYLGSVTDNLSSSIKLLIPEQDIALSGTSADAVEYQDEHKTYWFARKNGQPVGAVSGGLLNNQDAFEMSIGGIGSRQWKSLSFEQYKQHLKARLSQFNWLQVNSYLLTQQHPLSVKQLVPVAVSAAIVLVVYFAAVQAWLSYSNDALRAQALTLSEQAADVFQKQDELVSINQRASRLQSVITEQRLDPRVWLPLGEVIAAGGDVYRLTYSGRAGYIIEGESNNATDTLAQLRAFPLVVDAGFNSPTVETQGIERFSINLSLREPNSEAYRVASDMSLLDRAQTSQPALSASDNDSGSGTDAKTVNKRNNKKTSNASSGLSTSVTTDEGVTILGVDKADPSELPPSVRKKLKQQSKSKDKDGNNDK